MALGRLAFGLAVCGVVVGTMNNGTNAFHNAERTCLALAAGSNPEDGPYLPYNVTPLPIVDDAQTGWVIPGGPVVRNKSDRGFEPWEYATPQNAGIIAAYCNKRYQATMASALTADQVLQALQTRP